MHRNTPKARCSVPLVSDMYVYPDLKMKYI